MSERLHRLQAALEEPLLVTDLLNIRYLTGFDSSNAALLVEGGRVRLFSDFRYAEAGRDVEGVEFEETDRALIDDLGRRLSGRFGFEAHVLPYAFYRRLADAGLELVPQEGVVEGLRAVKDEQELEAIRRASALTSAAFTRLAEEPFVGRTERELAWRFEELLHELGAPGAALPPIVGAGANGSRPHAEPGDRPVERGELVVVDAAASFGGYCSDCTRTFSTGSLDGELEEIYRICLEAQLAGLGAAKAGVAARDADAAARTVIEEAGYGSAFAHGLGHGVGVDIHEAPRLATTSDDELEAGNVVTIEPGIYLEGRAGVRIEDLVVVTDGEPEVLTTFAKELVEVG